MFRVRFLSDGAVHRVQVTKPARPEWGQLAEVRIIDGGQWMNDFLLRPTEYEVIQ